MLNRFHYILVLCAFMLTCSSVAFAVTGKQAATRTKPYVSHATPIKFSRNLSATAQKCVSCHSKVMPGVVLDWKNSRHAHVGVSCIDCHAAGNGALGGKGSKKHKSVAFITPLVSPKVCARCHAAEVKQFKESGHYRAFLHIEKNKKLQALVTVHEGRNHPKYKMAPFQTGCMQCHGNRMKLQTKAERKPGRPSPSTWPASGIGTVYPDGSVGNCSACHTRHKFSIAEARKPAACSSCHLGPDHPDKEVFEASKHGQVFASEGNSWNWDSAPDAWEPGDYRGPTCATCHMSGIGPLKTTHNITERLYWNSWAPVSKPRTSHNVMDPYYGNGVAGRAKMQTVCLSCHTKHLAANFFKQADSAVKLYNEAYLAPAKKMLDTLQSKKLLNPNPWLDPFQVIYYHLWHHEGRRARHGALMAGADYAHWNGFFILKQDLYDLQKIYKKRMATSKIED